MMSCQMGSWEKAEGEKRESGNGDLTQRRKAWVNQEGGKAGMGMGFLTAKYAETT